MKLDLLLTNAHIATMRGVGLGIIERGSIGIADGRIAWIGEGKPDADCETRDLGGAWVTPGLIDCHTHLVFAGNRAAEFEMRLKGATYEEIAKAGGGIRSTVNATRAADELILYDQSARRLQALIDEGVTTVEIKSGYGLNTKAELKQLTVARALGRHLPVSVFTTFLGAHAVPEEFEGDRPGYVDHIVEKMLPLVAEAGLADAVDAFCENIAFTPAETSRIFAKARELGLKVKLHADQLSDGGGGALAASFDALSADHLEWTNESGIAAMANAGTVAVMLPGAFYCLRETKLPPIDLMRKHGVAMAVASDLNPGTSPIVSLQANMHMACTLFRMTPEEVLRGVTVNAAKALGLEDRGLVDVGCRADLAVWEVESVVELTYWMGGLRPSLSLTDGVSI